MNTADLKSYLSLLGNLFEKGITELYDIIDTIMSNPALFTSLSISFVFSVLAIVKKLR